MHGLKILGMDFFLVEVKYLRSIDIDNRESAFRKIVQGTKEAMIQLFIYYVWEK